MRESSGAALEDAFFNDIVAVATGAIPGSTSCARCIAIFEIVHLAALTQSPTTITNLLIRICNLLHVPVDAASCEAEYSANAGGLGPYLAQVFQKMSLGTQDVQAFCHYELSMCDVPPVIKIDESQWFSPKPADKLTAPQPSGTPYPLI